MWRLRSTTSLSGETSYCCACCRIGEPGWRLCHETLADGGDGSLGFYDTRLCRAALGRERRKEQPWVRRELGRATIHRRFPLLEGRYRVRSRRSHPFAREHHY